MTLFGKIYEIEKLIEKSYVPVGFRKIEGLRSDLKEFYRKPVNIQIFIFDNSKLKRYNFNLKKTFTTTYFKLKSLNPSFSHFFRQRVDGHNNDYI